MSKLMYCSACEETVLAGNGVAGWVHSFTVPNGFGGHDVEWHDESDGEFYESAPVELEDDWQNSLTEPDECELAIMDQAASELLAQFLGE